MKGFMNESTSYSSPNLATTINNNLGLIVLAALFFFGGFFIGSLWKENQLLRSGTAGTAGVGAPAVPENTGPTEEQLAGLPEVSDDDHIRGNKDADIVLVEYSDFECPFCAQFHPTTKQILEDYGDKVALVYRHYPLEFHPNAQKAGEASECVAKLGGDDAFWKYADAIFEKNNDLGGKISPEAITEAAEEAGVNMTNFQTCLDSGEMAEKVKEDMAEGGAAGVTGTPGTFIVTKDGAQELVPGAYPLAQVKAIVDKYVK